MNTSKTLSPETREEWSSNPDNWRWGGLLYYNKDDKRLFPPKKFQGFGWTVNFANPLSILAFAALIAAIIALGEWLKP